MKNAIKLVLIFLVVNMFWSCQNVLDVEPQTGKKTDSDFFKSKEDFDSFLFGAYAQMNGSFDGSGVSNWIIRTAFITQDGIGVDELAKPLTEYMNPSNFTSFWVDFYKMVTKANIVLDKLKDAPLSDEDKAIYEGEAKFIRGFGYFNLARAFGNVPLVLDVYDPSQNTLECTPENEIWAQVIKDLTEASQLLPTRDAWGTENLGRATKGSALAYLTNAYMYTKQWGDGETAAQQLIGLGAYRLLDDVRDIFSELTPNNDESIFEVQFRNISDGNITWADLPEHGGVLAEWTAPRNIGGEWAALGGWGETVMNTKLADSFDPADDRRQKLVKKVGETYKGELMVNAYTIPADIPQSHSAFSTKYWLGPPPDLNAQTLNDQNIPLMRYAEFLLNYSEILFENGKPSEAYLQLNKVRHRAKLPDLLVSPDRNIFIDQLMDERRWELNFEPNLWFHYTRTETAQSFLENEHGITWNPAWSKLPIPLSEIDQNPNLCQSPGY